ncbi:MAG: hypothetical protein ACT4PY_09905 [Armatimonadota bacterium]
MRALRGNPEFVRLVRAQLRTGRMVAAAGICAVIALVAGFALAYSDGHPSLGAAWGVRFFTAVMWAQALVLYVGGTLLCLTAIQREKDANTFDYQRVTRLTPLELTLGKLFGAPIMAYFIVLCLMPAALFGAAVGQAKPSFVLAGYVIVILGSITFHALALVMSVFARGGAGGTVILALLLLWWASLTGGVSVLLNLGDVTPLVGVTVAAQTSWALETGNRPQFAPFFAGGSMTDVLFGWPVHHVFVLIVLYTVFLVWFLLAIARNIKRDPSVYELLTPAQSLGFALYVNLILVGFFRWGEWPPIHAQGVMLTFNAVIFFVLGVGLLRGRDRLRRLQAAGAGGGWLAKIWPVPFVGLGALSVGLAVVAILHLTRAGAGRPWDLGLATFKTVFFTLWLARDTLFLQWMNLRRGRRPMVRGVLYVGVYYACVMILLIALDFFRTSAGVTVAAVLAPGSALALDPIEWISHQEVWLVGLTAQALACVVLVGLLGRQLAELSVSTAPGAARA